MKKLLLSALLVCVSASTVLPYNENNRIGFAHFLTNTIGICVGSIMVGSYGSLIDTELANEHFNRLKNHYKDNSKYMQKIADLEFKRATAFDPRRAALKTSGVAIGGLGGYVVADTIATYIGKKIS
ncbi:MAG TPA: hypothetical protein VLG50_01135 [Candidatus Saccharimonadales bacterium]|nr:hypothetical protein [Candidatus Saccharimonadales bacterium]